VDILYAHPLFSYTFPDRSLKHSRPWSAVSRPPSPPPPVEGQPSWLPQVGHEGHPWIHAVLCAVGHEARGGKSAAAPGELAGAGGGTANVAL
jgi:hypothetical protein